ncbi:thiamine biosynthesis protein ThiS [Celeribacter ethanolicus]|uniref:Thiamine biosynthesis protein ThiS n=1 Tax=Celeribacter ethanolicus TaxID=1758178 RepID=A0A291G9N8_9RHOB|nr:MULTISPECIES: sulfur carrier protein ThiS [Celeribacter]ATG46858.1 thiamine biosynthesis protein ThiS [Celeribacter ethanolicus]
MRIELNGQSVETTVPTLAALITEQNYEARSVASAVDGQFVPRDAREGINLTAGMKIELLSPMQGG